MHTGSSMSCIGFVVDVQPYVSFKTICAAGNIKVGILVAVNAYAVGVAC